MEPKELCRKFLHQYYKAFQVGDWSTFGDCLHEDFTYFTDGGTTQDKSSFLSFLSKSTWMVKGFDIRDLRIFSSEQMILATYRITFTGIYKDQPARIEAVETTLFTQSMGSWKIAHGHASNA